MLAGDAVIDQTELTLISTPGDMAEKVMKAMLKAREYGGDGRCSCSQTMPASCGSPPPSFNKSAHVASFTLARIGDVDGVCGSPTGCANGTYYLDFNVIGGAAAPDPILTLRNQYIAWRAALAGRPDHILSEVTTDSTTLPADGLTQRVVTVKLVDLDGVPLTAGGATVLVTPAPGTTPVTTTGPVTDHGDGTYSVAVAAGTQPGIDEYVITADDGVVTATLYPFLEIRVEPLTPLHCGEKFLSAGAGGIVPLTVNTGASDAGLVYFVLGSASGTQPGTPMGNDLVPLNADAFTDFTLLFANGAVLPNTLGLLDGNGHAEAAFAVPPGVLNAAIGLRLDWAAIAFGSPETITNPCGFNIVP